MMAGRELGPFFRHMNFSGRCLTPFSPSSVSWRPSGYGAILKRKTPRSAMPADRTSSSKSDACLPPYRSHPGSAKRKCNIIDIFGATSSASRASGSRLWWQMRICVLPPLKFLKMTSRVGIRNFMIYEDFDELEAGGNLDVEISPCNETKAKRGNKKMTVTEKRLGAIGGVAHEMTRGSRLERIPTLPCT